MMNDFTNGIHRLVLSYIELNASSEDNRGALIRHPSHHIEVDGEIICDLIENKYDAKLYATAGTTATKLAEAGYDAVKVLEVLPLIATSMGKGELATAFELLEDCRGE